MIENFTYEHIIIIFKRQLTENMPNPTTLARSKPASIAGPAAQVAVAVELVATSDPPTRAIDAPPSNTAKLC